MKKFKTLFTLALLSFVMMACSQPADQPSEGETPAESTGTYTPGDYEVEATGYAGTFKVVVSFDENSITKVEVPEHGETDGIGSNVINDFPQRIVDEQTLNIDAVVGATATSEGLLAAVAQAVTEAGGDAEALKSKEAATGDVEAIEETADVVVIGGGGAGLSAAVSAAQEGATVILIEKTGALGGNTIRAGGPYNAVDPERQAAVDAADTNSMEKIKELTEKEAMNPEHQALMDELKADIEEYEASNSTSLFDSIALHKLQTYDGGDYAGHLDLIQKLVDESLETSLWMEANGVEWTDDIQTVPGGLWPRAHLPKNAAGGDYIVAGQTTAEKLGVVIMMNTTGEELIVKDGRVVGVKATQDGNVPVTLHATKGVVIATGGFAANVEMRSEYDPTLVDTLPTTNTPAAQGEGIKMAEVVDASVIGMEFIQSLPLGNPADGGLNAWMGGSGVEYYYQINKEGERFMAEDGRRDTMTQALLAQTDAFSYVISGGNNKIELNGEGFTIWGDNIDELVENGTIFRADTIEELAQQIGIDPAVLKETHDRFNGFVESGSDEDFGRTLFGDPINEGPYFASPRVPTVHHTMGGLEINLNSEVLNSSGEVIEGLYAAGEVTGGIHGKNRLGGNALVDIHVFGREAGTNAANNDPVE